MAKIKHFEMQKKGLLQKIIQQRFERNMENYLFGDDNTPCKWSTVNELDGLVSDEIVKYFDLMKMIDDYYDPKIKEDEAKNNYHEDDEEEEEG